MFEGKHDHLKQRDKIVVEIGHEPSPVDSEESKGNQGNQGSQEIQEEREEVYQQRLMPLENRALFQQNKSQNEKISEQEGED